LGPTDLQVLWPNVQSMVHGQHVLTAHDFGGFQKKSCTQWVNHIMKGTLEKPLRKPAWVNSVYRQGSSFDYNLHRTLEVQKRPTFARW